MRSLGLRLTLLVAALLAAVPTAPRAQTARGTVQEGLTVQSRLLGKPVRYTIYLPPGYESSTRYYPVVYLLHGYGDNDMGWIQFGEADAVADAAIASREIPPMILVMPDAGVSWYVNNHDRTVRYEDFFIQEFLPAIESRYRIRRERRYRAVSGLSMGGFGSLVYGLRHPELFSGVAALSAAVYTPAETIAKDAARWQRVEAPVYGPALTGEQRFTAHYRSYSPLEIVASVEPASLRGLALYLDCGDDDFLTAGNAMLHLALRDRKIPHEYRVRDGAHSWSYWRSGLRDALRFLGTSFHQP